MVTTVAQWDNRIKVLVQKLPASMRRFLQWLLEPSHHWFRSPVAIALLFCGLFAPIPFVGVLLLPVGLVLLGEDLPWLKRPMEQSAQWLGRARTYIIHLVR